MQQWSKFIVSDFLQRWSQPALIEAKVMEMHEKLKDISDKLATRHEQQKQRIYAFRTVLWKQEQSQLHKQLLNGKGSAKSRETYIVNESTKK